MRDVSRVTTIKAVPLTLRQANAFVAEKHRHSRPVRGAKLSVGIAVRGQLVGVAIIGRPVSRRLDDGETIEVTRVCTDGTLHACSCLYGRVIRIARELGYKRVVTYTLASEPGSSLKAAGFVRDADVPNANWDKPSRPRKVMDTHLFGSESVTPQGAKIRWCRNLSGGVDRE